jgi:hypothetical protein
MSIRKIVLLVLAGLALAAAGAVVGRVSAGSSSAGSGDYSSGERAGEAQGRQEGRALQLPAGDPRDAFNAGYVAGANDAFTGYDGGWQLGVPYVITLEHGTGQIVYRISSRALAH